MTPWKPCPGRGQKALGCGVPGVALRLPPANRCHPFGMKTSKATLEVGGIPRTMWVIDSRKAGERGWGLTGYDNHEQKYVGMWVDSMTTSISTSLGTIDKSGKQFSFHRESLVTGHWSLVTGLAPIRE